MNAVFNPGLYAITPQRYPDHQRLLDETRAALEGGTAMIQFRDKSDDTDWRLAMAAKLKAECDRFDVPFIVNDDARLAALVGASGVHLGRGDPPAKEARAVVGRDALIGVSCYDSLDRARAAADQGADYLAFGSVYPSRTKQDGVHCALQTITRAGVFELPRVAIGGITPENGRAVIEAGADSLAVIGAVFETGDACRAARAFSELWA
jgi:thiamine-phosphate pyrophosphorylase